MGDIYGRIPKYTGYTGLAVILVLYFYGVWSLCVVCCPPMWTISTSDSHLRSRPFIKTVLAISPKFDIEVTALVMAMVSH